MLSANELRLLQPVRTDGHTLHFRTLTTKRASAPPYTAVSYTWGDGEATEIIYLDGQRFHVRPNLWSCLYNLGADARHAVWKYLWVDAICIDQKNDAERSAQVSLMDQTYRDAFCVSVWLGLPNEYGPVWADALLDLANRPYWSRVWVIQEVLLGRQVELVCGNERADWGYFRSILCEEAGIDEFSAEYKSNDRYGALPLIMGRHLDKHPEVSQPLYNLLIEHHQSKCKDPRDRVFALLGLISPEERNLLNRYFPDYTLKEDHVVILTLAHLIYATPLIAPQVDFEDISPDSEKLFLGLGVESKLRRKRLLRRAKALFYDSDGPVGTPLQDLTYDDEMEELGGADAEELYPPDDDESSCARKLKRVTVFMGISLGIAVLLWYQRR